MKFKSIIIFLFVLSCAQNSGQSKIKIPFNSKGFAYIYSENDYINKVIKRKMDNNSLEIAHNKLRLGSLIKLVNPKTKDFIILKNSRRVKYPDFYKILITKAVANKLNLKNDLPLVEVLEIKKNKSFIAKKGKIYTEEKTIHSNAPVQLVKIDNISKNKNKKKIENKDKIFIIIGEFYTQNSANLLKKRIIKELTEFDSSNLDIKIKKTNKITLLSGPYTSINLIKNDYIQLKNFGFEDLDISINE